VSPSRPRPPLPSCREEGPGNKQARPQQQQQEQGMGCWSRRRHKSRAGCRRAPGPYSASNRRRAGRPGTLTQYRRCFGMPPDHNAGSREPGRRLGSRFRGGAGGERATAKVRTDKAARHVDSMQTKFWLATRSQCWIAGARPEAGQPFSGRSRRGAGHRQGED